VPKSLKYTFLVHTIAALLFALGFLFAPDTVAKLFGYTAFEPPLPRMYGGVLLAVSLSSWLSYRASEPQLVKITAAMEVCLTIVAALVALYTILFESAPAMMWIGVVFFAVFAALFGAFYPRSPKN
jgi:hypothetical protein